MILDEAMTGTKLFTAVTERPKASGARIAGQLRTIYSTTSGPVSFIDESYRQPGTGERPFYAMSAAMRTVSCRIGLFTRHTGAQPHLLTFAHYGEQA